MDQHLNILVQSDENYAPFAGVMLTSLFENNQDIDAITVYLMTSDMSEKNRGRFQTLAKEYRREIKFIDAKEVDSFCKSHQLPQWRGSYTAYYKVFALTVIKDEIDRLIYLDADMVVTGSISELTACNLGNGIVGMCLDAISSKYKRLIKLDSLFYYNAGAIVFDVKKWIEYKCIDRIIEHLTTVHASYPFPEQDLLNIVFSESIATISQKYNCYPVIYLYEDYDLLKKSCGIVKYYSEEEVISAKREPAVLHCIEVFGLRPWHVGIHPYREVWNKYLNRSPWRDSLTLSTGNAPIMNKIQKYLFKTLPKNLFAAVNRNCVYILLWQKARKCGL